MKFIRPILFALIWAFSASAFAQPKIFTAPLTFTSASGTAYTANDVVGSVNTITNAARVGAGGYVQIDCAAISDDANQNKGFVLLFFDAAPTVTDNAAFSWGTSNTNLTHYLGHIEIRDDDFLTISSIGLVSQSTGRRTFKAPDTGTSIYVVCVTTSTPTYGNGGKIRVTLGLSYY